MASKTGSNTNAILQKAGTWGTAVEGGAGDKLVVNSLKMSRNTTALTSAPIGGGADMLDAADIGLIEPTATLEMDDRYDGPAQLIDGLFWGGESVVTGASSTYTHSYVYNPTRQQAFGTIASDTAAASVMEIASAIPTKMTVKIAPDKYVTKSVEFLGNELTVTSTTNTTATLAAATAVTTKKVIARSSDVFRINNASEMALTSAHNYEIMDAEVTYTYALDHGHTIRGVSGNGAPTASGQPPFTCELKVTLKNLADNTWFTGARAGTEYKASLLITSPDMAGGSIPYSEEWRFPRLKLMADPDWGLTSAGENRVTLTFTALVSATKPSGMADFVPHKCTVNATATATIA
jgi:hypothetical protein